MFMERPFSSSSCHLMSMARPMSGQGNNQLLKRHALPPLFIGQVYFKNLAKKVQGNIEHAMPFIFKMVKSTGPRPPRRNAPMMYSQQVHFSWFKSLPVLKVQDIPLVCAFQYPLEPEKQESVMLLI